jgi:hypothetical protein
MKTKISNAIAATSILFSVSSQAALIGVFGDANTNAITIASGLGHTAEAITDFSSLSSYDVVWGLNSDNSSHLTDLVGNQSFFDSYVIGGGVFMYHDRAVTDGNTVLAGADNFVFNRDFTNDKNIDLVGPNGVAGADIDNTTLDGGNSSSHGFVDQASIDQLFTGIFNNGVAGQLVDFHYEFGAGDVYYSTIPLDFYLSGGSDFDSVYAPNVLAYAVSLSDQDANPVSEPYTLSLFLVSMLALVGVRRRKG